MAQPPQQRENRQQRRAREKREKEQQAKAAQNSATTPEIQTVLEAALAHQTKGEYADADRMYKRVLDTYPGNIDALHFRGILAYQVGNLPVARELVTRATDIAKRDGKIRATLALIEDAAGNAKAARTQYQRALSLAPENKEARNNFGAFLRNLGEWDAAEVQFAKAIETGPEFLPALGNLGAMLLETGRLEEAANTFYRALEVAPDNPDSLMDLGIVLQRQGQFEAAEQKFQTILNNEPDNPAAHINMASLYFRMEKMEDGLRFAERGVELFPDHPAAHNNLGNLLGSLDRFDEAEAAFKKAIKLAPKDAEAVSNLAHLYKQVGRIGDAAALYQQAITFSPDNPRHRFGLSLSLMGLGRLEEALPFHEAGFDCAERRPDRRKIAKTWDGSPPGDRPVLIWPEQGLGDELRFISALPDLLDGPLSGAAVTLECDPRLVALFQRSFPDITVAAEGETEITNRTLQRSMGQAHDLVRREIAHFDRSAAYLKPDPELVKKWQDRLAALPPGPRIGFGWRSGLVNTRRSTRVTTIEDWRPLLETQGIQLIALQYGDTDQEREAAETRYGCHLHFWDDLDLRDDLNDLVALISCLDQVATIANSLGDLAGATGTPSLVTLPEHQWVTLGTDHHPWYPNVTLVQRRNDEDWTGVMQEIANRVKALI